MFNSIKPSKLFLLDALGAFTSILFLTVLYLFPEYFGMPIHILSVFIIIAVVYCLYSLTMHLAQPLEWRFYLKIIALLNISYGLFTSYHVYIHFKTLTLYGILYFIGEVLILLLLSGIELKTALNKNNQNTSTTR